MIEEYLKDELEKAMERQDAAFVAIHSLAKDIERIKGEIKTWTTALNQASADVEKFSNMLQEYEK